MSQRVQKNNLKKDDTFIPGVLVAGSGISTTQPMTVGSITTTSAVIAGVTKISQSGAPLSAINVIQQYIDFAASASGGSIYDVDFPFTSGAATLIGSGDYIIPLAQPVESGFAIMGRPAASGGTISLRVIATAAINPAAAVFPFMVVRSTPTQ